MTSIGQSGARYCHAPPDFNQHMLTLQAMNGNSIGDQNDYFTASIDY